MIRKEGNIDVRRDLAIILRSIDTELERIGNFMVRDVIKYIEREKIQVDGTLKKSVNYKVGYQSGLFTLELGAGAKYAYWVHEGRRPGKMPPEKPILRWVYRKLNPGKDAKSIAFLIRRKIGKKGYKGRPFIAAIHKEWINKLQARIDNAVARGLQNG